MNDDRLNDLLVQIARESVLRELLRTNPEGLVARLGLTEDESRALEAANPFIGLSGNLAGTVTGEPPSGTVTLIPVPITTDPPSGTITLDPLTITGHPPPGTITAMPITITITSHPPPGTITLHTITITGVPGAGSGSIDIRVPRERLMRDVSGDLARDELVQIIVRMATDPDYLRRIQRFLRID